MNIEEFLAEIKGLPPEKQIEAINVFFENSSLDDVRNIQNSINAISQLWLRNTISGYLNKYLNNTSLEKNSNSIIVNQVVDSEEKDVIYNVEDIRSLAVSESLGQIIHELDPLIGSLEVAANKEIENYDNSRVKGEIIRLQELVDTFTAWKKSAETPNYQKLKIYNVISDEVERIKQHADCKIIINIPTDLDFYVDNFMFRTIISNSLRNSTESHKLVVDRSANIIIISAGILVNDSLWISIIDEGIGLPVDQTKLFKSRYTTKPGSRGFGLTIIAKSIQSMKGIWDLKDSSPFGAVFYFEIPRLGGDE